LSESTWIFHNDTIGLLEPVGKLTLPSSREIYNAEIGRSLEIRGIVVQKPSDQIPELTISKYPVCPEIRVSRREEGNLPGVASFSIRVAGTSLKGHEFLVEDPVTRAADHILIGSIWYPFIAGSLEEIRRILASAGIAQSGRITLRQYFSLVHISDAQVPIRLNKEIDSSVPLDGSVPPSSCQIPAIRGTLYPYQRTGYQWLSMINSEDMGCILADEMGLGKTLQIICLLLTEKDEGGRKPSLIVAPATLLENWRRELEKFAPTITTLIHRGPVRTGFYRNLEQPDVVITSYETVLRDVVILRMVQWNVVVLDEAQAVKNPDAERTRAIKSLRRRVSIAVTGTPVENRLLDLWSLFDIVLPGHLGERGEFERNFSNSAEGATRLEPLISPVILRRRVGEVAADLPERIDIPLFLDFSQSHIQQYDEIRRGIWEECGPSASLTSLLRLRMFCCHPWLISRNSDSGIDPAAVSEKYQRLIEVLQEIFENNEKCLIFTSFIEMENILLEDLEIRFPGIFLDNIDGRVAVEMRQGIADEFNSFPGAGALILNPKAAGTGLNLTGATHVIHYNPEWNPATVDQASARAHRRGQTLPVTIHYFYLGQTIEEVMEIRLERKREISAGAVVGTTGEEDDYGDIVRALTITPFVEGECRK